MRGTSRRLISLRLQRFLVCALLAAAVIAVYAPVSGYDFIALDDAGYVRANEHINGGFSWAGLKWIAKNPVGGNWHPVTMLSHMADCQIYGLWPGGHHLTNVLLHAANAILVFWVLLKLTEPKKAPNSKLQTSAAAALARSGAPREKLQLPSSKDQSGDTINHRPLLAPKSHEGGSTINSLWPCALVAALFGLHPLRVESVAWIAERKDVLSAFFFLLTIWAYVRYAGTTRQRDHGQRSAIFYLLSLGLFALGLMSKPMLVTLPFVLLLLDYWPLGRVHPPSSKALRRTGSPMATGRTPLALIVEKIPFFALAAGFSVITFFVQKSYGAVVELKYLPLSARLGSVMVSYADYIGKTFWPHPLAMLYPYREWTSGQIAGSAFLFGAVSLAAILLWRRKPYFFVGWFWFVGMLVPVVGFVQVGIQVTADRYTYLPSIGISMALAWGLADWLTRASQSRDADFRPKAGTPQGAAQQMGKTIVAFRRCCEPRKLSTHAFGARGPWLLAVSGAILAVALLAVTAAAQVRFWKNTETLFAHAVRVTGDNTEGHYMLGALFVDQGKMDEAFSEFTQSVRDNPAYIKARCGLGYIFLSRGQFEEAAEQYRTAVQIEADSAKAHFGLAEVLRKERKDDEAIEQYSLALKFEPNLAEAHYQLAGLYSARHDAASAISHLRETVRLSPGWFLALNNLAWMLATQPDAQLRNGAEARELAMRAAAAVGRNNPNALDTLAAAYAEMGRFADAVRTAQSAVQAASTEGETNLVAEISSRLRLYQSEHVFRE